MAQGDELRCVLAGALHEGQLALFRLLLGRPYLRVLGGRVFEPLHLSKQFLELAQLIDTLAPFGHLQIGAQTGDDFNQFAHRIPQQIDTRLPTTKPIQPSVSRIPAVLWSGTATLKLRSHGVPGKCMLAPETISTRNNRALSRCQNPSQRGYRYNSSAVMSMSPVTVDRPDNLGIDCDIRDDKVVIGRDPRDAWLYTQRICGVRTTVHAICSVRAVENALGLEVAQRTVITVPAAAARSEGDRYAAESVDVCLFVVVGARRTYRPRRHAPARPRETAAH